MITKENFPKLLDYLKFIRSDDVYTKSFGYVDLKVDFLKKEIIYPKEQGLIVNERQTCNFSSNENFVVFECIHRLLEKGYKPEHLELEPRWKIGHGASGGRADILIKDQQNKPLLLIECKTAGAEFENAWRKTQQDGDQLFSYAQQISETQYLCLYASDFDYSQVRIDQRIIAHKDNDRILALDSKLKAYATASDVSERFSVWRDTYNFGFTESGIFEENIQPYQIGKNKYTLADDTKSVDATDKEGKYHQFRTILRKYNIARRENAFEVLVNLFLCKIVDEEDNKSDLKFYWKGQEYDNDYDFVDRLQNLYQRGMDKFLHEKISYISNEQIDNAFWTVKNKRNATKKQIQAYFRELKFFSNSAFSFIDTYNEALFQKNAAVLREIVGMWQGLRLKTEEHNQFLGDMFEFFLDNSIKQSEGQFFTPLPICKFIISSLPLAHKIANTFEPLRALDYACGAGHFLNEYAYQIKPLVENIKHDDPARYYEKITGVEKEGRLAKVAKVAAFMYGQEQIKILDADALTAHPDIPQAGFDVLVANPPFAVEGFLQTLSDEDKERYQLIEETGRSSNTNNIQCFFLERIHHLMAPDGVVGVIVPSSILSNSDGIHTRTREVLLQFFALVSITELGSGTFGKTGTNTAVLFLRRKTQQPEVAEHYRNRVDDFFEGDAEGEDYRDHHLIRAYCNHIGVSYDQYIKLFGQTNDESLAELLEYEIFKDYRKDFEARAEIKNLKKTKTFKNKEKNEQQAELDKRFVAYLHKIEKDKLYFFILAHEQACKVLIVNAPNGNKERKQYLGYEWSGAKGSEGIRYYGGDTVNNIITPMFDPSNLDNSKKINSAIKKNFIGETTDPLPDHCHYDRLVDMLDFSRTEFNKVLSLNPRQNIEVKVKYNYEIKRLGDVASIESGFGFPISYQGKVDEQIPFLKVSDMNLPGNEIRIASWNNTISVDTLEKLKAKSFPSGTIIFPKVGAAIATNKKRILTCEATYDNNVMGIIPDINKLLPEFLHTYLEGFNLSKWANTANPPSMRKKVVEEHNIPLPPLDIQKQIIAECEIIDEEDEQSRQTIYDMKNQIEEKVQEVINTGHEMKKLGDFMTLNYGISLPENDRVPGDFPVFGSNGIVGNHNSFLIEAPCIIVGRKGSAGEINWSNKNCTPIDTTFYVELLEENSTDLKFIYLVLKSLNLSSMKVGSGSGGINRNTVYAIRVPMPPLDIQKQLVAKVAILEEKITEAEQVQDNCAQRKNAVLESYLY